MKNAETEKPGAQVWLGKMCKPAQNCTVYAPRVSFCIWVRETKGVNKIQAIILFVDRKGIGIIVRFSFRSWILIFN